MKEKRGIYDFLSDKEKTKAWTEKGTNLIIDKYKTNPIDTFFRDQLKVHYWVGIKFNPRMIMGWYVFARNGLKQVEGRIVDIYPTRDLLVKTATGLNICVPFDHVRILRKNKP